ncbi:DUF2141 domain-containing protein [uncultured Sphingomonas sp.]|uniref:DUF2141 domain-containing protein n=1 Tax=uncultured Sphingomonas sp. TaxID=158754 RepID=UPI0035C993D7
MPSIIPRLFAAGLALPLALTPAGAAPLGDKGCGVAGRPAVLVSVTGLKAGGGNLRVQAYGPDPATFLQKGRWVRRIDVPIAGGSAAEVCVTLSRAGRFAVAVRHDANANRKSDWNDGGGFSRNPKVTLLRLKPSFEAVVITVPQGTVRADIVMNYRRGLSIGPLK